MHYHKLDGMIHYIVIVECMVNDGMIHYIVIVECIAPVATDQVSSYIFILYPTPSLTVITSRLFPNRLANVQVVTRFCMIGLASPPVVERSGNDKGKS